ncbi:MAG TPA: hypothetical protein G4O14_07145 [Anaerolineae bacterium]|nr:hypothetical protein [Anaerolineae bacterium]
MNLVRFTQITRYFNLSSWPEITTTLRLSLLTCFWYSSFKYKIDLSPRMAEP